MESTFATGVQNAVTLIMGLLGEVVTFITSNELCLIFIAAGLIGIVFTVFRKAKKSAK